MFQVHYRKLHWSYKNSASAKCLIFESALLSGGFRGQNKVDQTVYTVLNFLYVTGSMALSVYNSLGWHPEMSLYFQGSVCVLLCFACSMFHSVMLHERKRER